jgi:MFS family permease
MSLIDLIPTALRALPRDAVVLFLTRFLRLFAYGALSVVLVFYLVSLGLREVQVGLLLTLTLAGDIAISLLLTTRADQMGRRRTLIVGAILMAGAGIAFASTHNLLFLIVAGTIGVISRAETKSVPFFPSNRRHCPCRFRCEPHGGFAWYTLAGSVHGSRRVVRRRGIGHRPEGIVLRV